MSTATPTSSSVPSTSGATARTTEPKVIEDCLSCRVMGGTVFAGLGVYTYISGHNQLRENAKTIQNSKSMFGMRSRQMGITGIAATFVFMGIYRLVGRRRVDET